MAVQFLFSKTFLVLMVIGMALANVIHASPPRLASDSSKKANLFEAVEDCENNDELLDLCQRCAKLTKSSIAITSCCSSDFEARRFCSDYVYFGRGQ